MRWVPGSALLLLGAWLLLVGGCECPPRGPGIAYYRMPADSVGHPGTRLTLPGSSLGSHTHPSKGAPPPPPTPVDKIHPDVRAAIIADPSASANLIVSFRDTISGKVPIGLTGPILADTMRALRAPSQAADSANLIANYQVTILDSYWLIEAFRVRMPLSQVQNLATEDRVVRIEPERTGAPPTECGSSSTPVAYTAEIIQAASVFAPFSSGRIALFDTGVYDSHKLLSGSEFVGTRWQCTPNGCVQTTTQDDLYEWGHGTASASILVASSELGEQHRGLTQAQLDSYLVYDASPLQTNLGASINAFQAAMLASPRYDVFLPVIAVSAGGAGALTQLANWAYEGGILVIAPNGTVGGTEIPSPAVAPLAVGVGAYCMQSGDFRNDYNVGVTADGRAKPDLTAPTYVYTAARDLADPNKLGVYLGTSCAAPVAAGAALMLRNWLSETVGTSVNPGAVYAVLFACAKSEGAAPEEGAGRLNLPASGTLLWGAVALEEGQSLQIPVEVADGIQARVSAAIWWAEKGDEGTGIPTDATRDDFDLYLMDGDGTVRSSATSFTDVLERVEQGDASAAWKLEIVGYRVREASKDVFWALWIQD